MFTGRSNLNRIRSGQHGGLHSGGGSCQRTSYTMLTGLAYSYACCCMTARSQLIGYAPWVCACSVTSVRTRACTQVRMASHANYTLRSHVYASDTSCALSCSCKHVRAVCAVFVVLACINCRWYRSADITPVVCMPRACNV